MHGPSIYIGVEVTGKQLSKAPVSSLTTYHVEN